MSRQHQNRKDKNKGDKTSRLQESTYIAKWILSPSLVSQMHLFVPHTLALWEQKLIVVQELFNNMYLLYSLECRCEAGHYIVLIQVFIRLMSINILH